MVWCECRYTPAVVGDGTASQASNPEVAVTAVQSNTVINNQILQLKLVTTKLKNAYNGLDVDSIDMGMMWSWFDVRQISNCIMIVTLCELWDV